MNKTRPCKEEVIENKYNVNGLDDLLALSDSVIDNYNKDE